MSVLAAALISFFGFALLMTHLAPSTRRRIAGYAMWFDIAIHVTVLYVFFGTSTLGLLQAELSAIMFTVSLRIYRFINGYERLERGRWVRYSGLRSS